MSRTIIYLTLAWASLALAACSETDGGMQDADLDTLPDGDDDAGDAGLDAGDAGLDGTDSFETTFIPASSPEGEALWLEGEVDDDGLVNLELWGSNLGSIFGFATHIGFDVDFLEVSGDDPIVNAEVLGADGANTARYLTTIAAGDVSFGGTLISPELDEVDVGSPTLLATLHLRAISVGRSTITLERAVVRRADGSFVALSIAGGQVSFAGGES